MVLEQQNQRQRQISLTKYDPQKKAANLLLEAGRLNYQTI
jgi:hypothetical protein